MKSPAHDNRLRQYVARLDRVRTSLAEELKEEIEMVRDLTMTDRGRWVASACAAADAIVRARKGMGMTAHIDEPPAPDFSEKWRRLRQRFQSEHERKE